MAKFNRKVERQKTKYQFTKKEEIKKTKLSILKDNLTFAWIPQKGSSLVILIIVFVLVTFTVIPLLMQNYSQSTAMIVGQGIITPILLTVIFTLMNKETKPSLLVSCIRCLYLSIILLIFVLISLWVL